MNRREAIQSVLSGATIGASIPGVVAEVSEDDSLVFVKVKLPEGVSSQEAEASAKSVKDALLSHGHDVPVFYCSSDADVSLVRVMENRYWYRYRMGHQEIEAGAPSIEELLKVVKAMENA